MGRYYNIQTRVITYKLKSQAYLAAAPSPYGML